MAQCVFLVFIPALTLSNLALAVSIDTIVQFWALLANMTLSLVLGLVLGVLAAWALRVPAGARRQVIAAVGFGNVGNLPLTATHALCQDRGAVFFRALGARCNELGIAYIAFDIAAATLWQFTVAIQLLKAPPWGGVAGLEAKPEAAAEAGGGRRLSMSRDATVSDLLDERERSLRSQRAHADAPSSDASDSPRAARPPADGWPEGGGGGGGGGGGLIGALPAGPAHRVVELQPWESPGKPPPGGGPRAAATVGAGASPFALELQGLLDSSQPSSALAGGGAAAEEAAEPGCLPATRRAGRAAWGWLAAVDWAALFPLPSQAAILGIFIGCVPLLKGLFYGPGNPPLRVISGTLGTLSGGMIPCAIMLLGAVLMRCDACCCMMLPSCQSRQSASDVCPPRAAWAVKCPAASSLSGCRGPGASRLPWRVTAGVLVTRLILLPALMTGLVLLALRLGVFKPLDPMFLLVILLSNATPTAINLQVWAQEEAGYRSAAQRSALSGARGVCGAMLLNFSSSGS